MKFRGVDFEANIVGKRKIRLGEAIRFRARFDGALVDGYFTAKVVNVKGEKLPLTGLDHEWWPCYDTYDLEARKGRIRGTRLHEYEWNGTIRLKYPTGDYEAIIVVLDGQGVHIRETKPIPFKVVRGTQD
jgi:hypothetical protein